MSQHNNVRSFISNDAADNSYLNGFSRLIPSTNYYNDNVSGKPHKVMTKVYKDFVANGQEYAFFITLTFGLILNRQQCCKYINDYLHRHNSYLFGRGYYNSSLYISGFAFIENHKKGGSVNDIHFHLLIKITDRYNDFTSKEHKSILWKSVKNIKHGKYNVFNKQCICITDYRDDGAINYCFVDLWDRNLTAFKIIGKDGLSDNL